jgi:hypothetical protein
MATTGVVGQTWRADVTETGSVVPWDGSPQLDWFVAADDRWHDPRTDSAVRHWRLGGTAVFETKLRIPNGDAVQRVWSVADGGGHTIVEVRNDSPLPIAVAFTRADIVTGRPPTDVPIQGIDVPASTVLLPVGHRATVTVALPHGSGSGAPTLPARLPPSDAVARGWTARADAASRLDLPEPSIVDAVKAARCEVLLRGAPHPDDDPVRHLLALGELVRLGEIAERDAVELAPAVASAVSAVAVGDAPWRDAALDAAGVVLAAANERRALNDLAALRRRISTSKRSQICPDLLVETSLLAGVEAVAAVERRIVAGSRLFPGGIPPAWRGADFEAHGLVAGPRSRLSLALRWHGANPAVLWELTGDPVPLSSAVPIGGWSTDAPTGEALWRIA